MPASVIPFLLPSVFPSIKESVHRIRQPKYWSFNFSISPSNEYTVLISFRMDSFHLLVVQGTLKSLLQHHSSKASILWCSAFFMVQLSHPYMTTGETMALTGQIFVGKVLGLSGLMFCDATGEKMSLIWALGRVSSQQRCPDWCYVLKSSSEPQLMMLLQ